MKMVKIEKNERAIAIRKSLERVNQIVNVLREHGFSLAIYGGLEYTPRIQKKGLLFNKDLVSISDPYESPLVFYAEPNKLEIAKQIATILEEGIPNFKCVIKVG
jgi:hypothetical protein